MSNKAEPFELDPRELEAAVRENTGNPYNRIGYISDLALEAKFQAAEKPFERCSFSNKYGLCKLEVGHDGTHTVINLGAD